LATPSNEGRRPETRPVADAH
ncbi:hypothetical protein ALC60_07022, partial [Trachymyrmex zeteki]